MTGFRATGKGYHNALPNVPADARNASAKLVNNATGEELYLFATGISRTWSLAGSASQTQARRTFYPQHLMPGPVIVKGICANQYEYDRIVQFVEQHHHSLLGLSSTKTNVFGGGISSAQFTGEQSIMQTTPGVVDFMLLPSVESASWIETNPVTNEEERQAKGQYRLPPFFVAGVIEEIRAGHERFKNAPEFEIGLKVVQNKLGELAFDMRDVRKSLGWYEAGLGKPFNPDDGSIPDETGSSIITDIDNIISAANDSLDALFGIFGSDV